MTSPLNVCAVVRRSALGGVVALLLASTASAAATTRFASPGGDTTGAPCTSVAAPCSLTAALGSAEAGDSLSLAAGSYDLAAVQLPAVPLHWISTMEEEIHTEYMDSRFYAYLTGGYAICALLLNMTGSAMRAIIDPEVREREHLDRVRRIRARARRALRA